MKYSSSHKQRAQGIHKPARYSVYLLIQIAAFTLISASVFGAPGKRTYTGADIEKEKKMELLQPDNSQEEQTQKVELQLKHNEEQDHKGKDYEQKFPEGQLYKVEHYTTYKTNTNVPVGSVQKIEEDNYLELDAKEFRERMRKVREKKESVPNRIPVSEEQMLEAKQRIIDKLGIDVPVMQQKN